MYRITYRRAGWNQPRSRYFGSRTAVEQYAEKLQRTAGRKPLTELRIDITAAIYWVPVEEWDAREKRPPNSGSFSSLAVQSPPVGVDLSELGYEDHDDDHEF